MLKRSFSGLRFYFKLYLNLVSAMTIFFVLVFAAYLIIINNQARQRILTARFHDLSGKPVKQLSNYVNESFTNLNSIYYLIISALILMFAVVFIWNIFNLLHKRDSELKSYFVIGKSTSRLICQLLIELLMIILISMLFASIVIFLLLPFFKTTANNINANFFDYIMNRVVTNNLGNETSELQIIKKALSNNTISMYNVDNIFLIPTELITLNFSKLIHTLIITVIGIIGLCTATLALFFKKRGQNYFVSQQQ
ncbi:FtsX-like permease family protein [Xylocopilactobacillus apicola]|nr:FtsX-like permease family protein [Xylocopilactobacillus apicola]